MADVQWLPMGIRLAPPPSHNDIKLAAQRRMAAIAGPAFISERHVPSSAPGARIAMSSRNRSVWPCDCLFMPTDRLARLNSFPKDAGIVFLEGPHLYFILNEGVTPQQLAVLEGLSEDEMAEVLPQFATRVKMSVTSLLKGPFPVFDAKKVLGDMSDDVVQEKYGMTDRRAIARQWKVSNTAKADIGTTTHAAAETFYNTGHVSTDPRIQIEMKQLREFAAWMEVNDWEVVRTEPMPWLDLDPPNKQYLAGSVDLVARHRRTNKFGVFDYKRTGKDLTASLGGIYGFGTGAFSQVENLPRHHYSVQLHIYRQMLMSPGYSLDIPVENLYLVRFHPKTKTGTFEVIQAFNYEHLARELMVNYELYSVMHERHKQHEREQEAWMNEASTAM